MAGSFLSAWLRGDPTARAWVAALPDSPQDRREAARRAKRAVAPALIAALRAKDQSLPPSPARQRAITALSDGAAAVVTGQQVGLFLGPLYAFYKAASAIKLARALEAESGLPIVPVFWLASEDHDHAEINHAFLPGPHKLGLPDDGRRVSVSERRLGPAVTDATEALAAAIEGLPHAAEVLELVRRAYRPERGYVDAFAELLASCFIEEGLVLVDPRDPAVAALAQPILVRAIREHESIEPALEAQANAIEAAGYPVQVPLRRGSPLVFFHLDGATGPRHRLQRTDAGFGIIVTDRTIVAAELEHPAAGTLSSSALLRPLVQDSLLPTVAYVGGPGELAYLAELGPLYAHFAVPRPAFALRARLRVIEASTRSLLERTGLSASEVEAPRDRILERLCRDDLPSPDAVRDRLLEPLRRALDELEPQATSLDENLRRPLARTRESIEQAVTRFVERYGRARLEKDTVTRDRVDRLQAALYPDGAPQERVLGFCSFAATVGLARWKALVLAAIDPFDSTIQDLIL